MNKDQLERLDYLRTKPKLTKDEWEEYEGLVKLQYETGHNDPQPDEENADEAENQPN